MFTLISIIAFPVTIIGVGVILILIVAGKPKDAVGWAALILHLGFFGWAAYTSGTHLWRRFVIGSNSEKNE
jgi:hypothetical protein